MVLSTDQASLWWRALKPGSWSKLLVPLALGQAIGIAHAGRIDLFALLLGIGFTLADLAFVVLLNDYGDRDVDALKRRMYPEGCSPKTIPDGLLPARAVRRAGLLAGALALAIALAGELLFDRPGLTLGGLLCLLLFQVYSFPPLRLNYRGGGEWLEMLGVGLVLPWWNAFLQGGEPLPGGLLLLLGFCLLAASSALGSGLSDECSDARGGKRTVVVRLGNGRTKLLVEVLVLAAAVVWGLSSALLPDQLSPWMLLPVCAWLGLRLVALRRLAPAAVTDAFRELRSWKAELNGTIMTSGTWISAALVLRTLLLPGIGS